MPRTARIDLGGYPYHVINRGVMRLKIFNTDAEYRHFERLLEHAACEIDMRILAYCLMPNHWHLLLYPKKDGDMKLFMHRLTNAHTRYVHSRTDTVGTGPLYQGRYKSFIIQEDLHLLTVFKYIERNAVRAGLSDFAETWKWGSAWRRTYGSTEQQRLLSTSPVPLPQNYFHWINMLEKTEDIDKIRNSVKKSAPYGHDSWVEKTVEQFSLGHTLRGAGRPKNKEILMTVPILV